MHTSNISPVHYEIHDGIIDVLNVTHDVSYLQGSRAKTAALGAKPRPRWHRARLPGWEPPALRAESHSPARRTLSSGALRRRRRRLTWAMTDCSIRRPK